MKVKASGPRRSPARKAAPAPARQINSVIDLWLGEQLRHRRKALGLALQEVASACDISVSLLSQMERGLRSISPRTLAVVAKHLRVPMDSLVGNARPARPGRKGDGAVVRAGKHRRIHLDSKGILKENLTPPAAAGGVQLYRATIEPGGSTGEALFFTTSGGQVGYVIEGQLELFVEDRLLRLSMGDSFSYDGLAPRRWRNPGPTSTTVLWAMAQ